MVNIPLVIMPGTVVLLFCRVVIYGMQDKSQLKKARCAARLPKPAQVFSAGTSQVLLPREKRYTQVETLFIPAS